jgi:alpha-ketoglutarate-dependent taurine dioxygenase
MSQDEPDDEAEPGLRFFVPSEEEAGTYANALAVWHTQYEFTLDFAAMQPLQPVDEDDTDSPVMRPCRVVSRIRLPLTRMFDVLRALNASMTKYEAEWGEIRRPERQGNGA